MLFNSIQFWLFFGVVYALYLLLNHQGQNRLLLIASYVFYGAWDYRFLSLILVSTIVDYICGLRLAAAQDQTKRKQWLALSLFVNLGILGFFKYFNFFADSFGALLAGIGFQPDAITLNIILPIGISFYTFQTMSYTIDIYRREVQPTRDFLDFALYVAFFPQLIAGPIERAKRFLPQISSPRTLTMAKTQAGIWLILIGLFKKVVIADNCARIVDSVFQNYQQVSGFEALFGLYAFAFQIYGDFSGYSDIARGLARLMGFNLMVNFRQPYLAVNPSDFWTRWHISLSSWLRDYLYIPLGGNRKGTFRTFSNLTVTMLLGGLWHGASWMFVLWGAYHGALLILERVYHAAVQPWLSPVTKSLHDHLRWTFKVVFMFHLTCLGWLFFRAGSLDQMATLGRKMIFHFHIGDMLTFLLYSNATILCALTSMVLLIVLLRYGARHEDLAKALWKSPSFLKVTLMGMLLFAIVTMGSMNAKQFIYFQF